MEAIVIEKIGRPRREGREMKNDGYEYRANIQTNEKVLVSEEFTNLNKAKAWIRERLHGYEAGTVKGRIERSPSFRRIAWLAKGGGKVTWIH
jgi:hypothetical protein